MKLTEKEYLEHFGVRGMRWGVRKRSSDRTDKGQTAERSSNKSTDYAPIKPPTNRQLNKAAKANERETGAHLKRVQQIKNEEIITPYTLRNTNAPDQVARRAKIDAARQKVYSGQVDTDLAIAKQKYRSDKAKLGSYKAKQLLKEERIRANVTYNNADLVRDGQEFAMGIILEYGSNE